MSNMRWPVTVFDVNTGRIIYQNQASADYFVSAIPELPLKAPRADSCVALGYPRAYAAAYEVQSP